jgi:general secretion pathway protein A
MQSTPLFSAQTIAAVSKHSRGFPRLINTICENALITAYARQSATITPDIIREVSEELRLDVVFSPKTNKLGGSGELDAERAKSLLLDLYATLQSPSTNHSGLVGSLAHEMSEHEPDI